MVDDADLDTPLPRLLQDARGREEADREQRARVLAARLDLPMTVLGMIFLLVVLGQTLARDAVLQLVLGALSWALWVVFVAEFLLRLVLAPSRWTFLRRNWWQVIFLILPVLRFLRLLFVLRLARAGRVLSSAVRSSRSAQRVLSGRLGWMAAVTVIVVLSASQLLYAFTGFSDYADALHAAALTTITGEPLPTDDSFSRVTEVLLAVYSVVVFAGLAGALGAYFLEPRLSDGVRGLGHEARQSAPVRPAGPGHEDG